MPKIEYLTGSPSPYSNHVRIERTRSGSYRFDGVSNARDGAPLRIVSPHYNDLEEAKIAAATWATANEVALIYLPPLQ